MSTSNAQVDTNGLTYEQVLSRAASGDNECRYQAGLMFHYGTGVEKDAEQAFHYCQIAAEKGHVRAQAYVGHCYLHGKLYVKRNYRKAFHWYSISAKKGYAPAQYSLANFHMSGKGTHRSRRTALHWYEQAAAQDYPKALFQLARAHKLGKGLAQDDVKSLALLEKAAEGGYDSAQYLLGLELMVGNHIDADMDQALRWLDAAACQGHESAEKTLEELDEFHVLNPSLALFCGLPRDCRLPLRRKTLIRMEFTGKLIFPDMADDVSDFVSLNPEVGFHYLEDIAGLALQAADDAYEEGEIVIANHYQTKVRNFFA